MDFRLLGPFEVWHAGSQLPISAPMQRALLVSLLVRPGAVVSLDVLVDDLWGHRPPRTAVATLRNYVRRLRVLLPKPVLVSATAGYRLTVAPEQVDLHRFSELVATARATSSVEVFDRALALWRGDPLTNIGAAPLRVVQAPRIEETYLAGLEAAVTLRLDLGRHADLVAWLVELNSAYPLRESLCRALMLALYRTARAPEALARYREFRARLITEVGMEPGPDLRALETAILREDPCLLADTAAPRDSRPGRALPPPRLPALGAPFLGRDAEVAELSDRLTARDDAAVHCVIYGQGGTGKSSLAVRMARELADRYPDGTLYVDLGGSTPGVPVRTPAEVVGMLIHALGGVEPRPDQDLAVLLRGYRTRLRGRRMMLILDNAANAEQVLPALPDEANCVALVTSRVPITGAGTPFHLGPLSPHDAVALLAGIAGARKVSGEPEAASRIAELCGRLPLALRLIANRAALRPHWPLSTWADLLADEHSRLDLLRHEDVDVRASFLIGLEGLRTSGDAAAHDAAALFPVLGLLSPPHVTAALAAALTGWSVARAERALDALLHLQMLYSPGPGRYVFYDLISLVAKEQARPDATEPLRRAIGWYVAAVRVCSLVATGAHTEYGLPHEHHADSVTVHFERYDDVRSWLDHELPVIVALLQRTVEQDRSAAVGAALVLVRTLPFYFNSAMPWAHRAALATLLLDHAPEHATLAYTNLAIIEGQRGAMTVARQLLDKARAHLPVQQGDDDPDTVHASLLLESTEGIVLANLGNTDGALARFERVLATATRSGFRAFETTALSNIANTCINTGRPRDALALLDRAVATNQEIGHQLYVAINRNTVLQAYAATGEHHEVVRRAPEVQAQHDRLGDAHQRAEHLVTVAASLQALGNEAAAQEHLARARKCLATISHREQVHAATMFGHLAEPP